MTKIKKILAACRVDGKQAAVLGCAAALAEKQAAELHLLHVLPEQGSERQAEGDVRHAREQLEALLPPEQVINLRLRWEVRHGSTSKAIVDYVKEADIDMIVMGSHHRSGLKRMASSSTSAQVLKATCDWMIRS